MIIDSHIHCWKYNRQRDTWMDDMPVLQKDHLPGDLQGIFLQQKVDGCIAVQADQSETETHFLEELSQQYDCIKGLVGWTDLCSPAVEERLEYFSQYPIIKGWRHIAQAEPAGFLADKAFRHGIRSLGKYAYTYDLLVYPSQLKEAVELVCAFPDQKFVLDHCGKPSVASGEIQEWKKWLTAIAAQPHVYCKLSGLLTEADHKSWKREQLLPSMDIVFEAFGCERIMFGSDWPVLNAVSDYAAWLNIVKDYLQQFDEAERQKVWSENAARFYNIGK